MKAARVDRYGPPEVVRVRDVPVPQIKENEILIGVHAATMSSGDWRMRSGTFPDGMAIMGRLAMGLRGPRQKVLGNDLSGVVTGVGPAVTRFAVGDAVIAQTSGTHAEFAAVSENGAVARKPENLGFEQAAAMGFGGGTALHFFKKGGLRAGDHLLVNGASGSVGSAMVNLGTHFGADVTAVCSAGNTGMVRALGADHVIDYATEDFTEGGARFDLIADIVGTAPYSRAKAALKPGGRFLIILGDVKALMGFVRPDKALGHQVIGGVAAESGEVLAELTRIAEAGKFSPAIDSTYKLDGIVAAHRRVETGRKRGNVVVTMPVMDGAASAAG